MTDDLANEKSAGAILDAADHHAETQGICRSSMENIEISGAVITGAKCARHPNRPATAEVEGVKLCPECESQQPSYVKRKFLTAVLLAFVLAGCARRVAPEPAGSTEMGRYYESMRAFDVEAMQGTLAVIDTLDEQGYRDDLGKRLQASAKAARAELSQTDAALSMEGYTPEKAKALLERRIREASNVGR